MIVRYKQETSRGKEQLLRFSSPKIRAIFYGTDTNNQVMLYGKHNYSHLNDRQNTDFALFKLIKCSNLDIHEAACLYIVHISQHSTLHPMMKSTRSTMVNAPKKHSSLLLVANHDQYTMHSPRRRQQATRCKSGFVTGSVRALQELHNLWLIMKPAAEKQQETY